MAPSVYVVVAAVGSAYYIEPDGLMVAPIMASGRIDWEEAYLADVGEAPDLVDLQLTVARQLVELSASVMV